MKRLILLLFPILFAGCHLSEPAEYKYTVISNNYKDTVTIKALWHECGEYGGQVTFKRIRETIIIQNVNKVIWCRDNNKE